MKVSILVLAIAARLMAQAPPNPTIRVPVRLVAVPTLVFSKEGRLLPGLEAANFRVLDNGTPQRFSLDTMSSPVSLALVVQANQDVRDYLRFIVKTGSVIESLLLGESGEAGIVAYDDEVRVAKTFDAGEVGAALRSIRPGGKRARMIDAGLRALELLAERPESRSRILMFVGQPLDNASESTLANLREKAEKEGVTVFAITLPQFGKSFVSDVVSLEALSSQTDRGGWKANVDLGKLISAAGASGKKAAGADPFTQLAAATGGTQIRIRRQREFEDALAAIGVQLRSSYVLSFSPGSSEVSVNTQTGYHTIRVEVNIRGAKTHTRPGYWLEANAR